MITIGEFIDEARKKNEIVNYFFSIWEQTAPIFYGQDYRLEPLREDFIINITSEIESFGHGCVEELKKLNANTKLHQHMSEIFSKALETITNMAHDCIGYINSNHRELMTIMQTAPRLAIAR